MAFLCLLVVTFLCGKHFYHLIDVLNALHIIVGKVKSVCPNEICESVYQGKGSIIRADDGDIYIFPSGNITNATICGNLDAVCVGSNCTACKCMNTADTDTWEEKKGKCYTKNGGMYVKCVCMHLY